MCCRGKSSDKKADDTKKKDGDKDKDKNGENKSS